MALTCCQLFAERGDPMDSRVRLDFGYGEREPARAVYRTQPDGSVHGAVTGDHVWWNELPDAPIPYHHPSPTEKPLGSNVEARLNFKKLDRKVVVAFNRPAPGTIVERPKSHVFVPHTPKVETVLQAPPKEHVQDASVVRARKHLLTERGKMRLPLTLDHYCEIINLFGSYAAFASTLK